MLDESNLSTNIMHHFYHQKLVKMYLLDQNIINKNNSPPP